jgi:hypothetical protein
MHRMHRICLYSWDNSQILINLQWYLVINIWTSSNYNIMHACYVYSGTIVLVAPKRSEFRPIS